MKSTLPDGVTVSARARRGRRMRVPKLHQRVGSTMAMYEWPEDGLIAKRVPQLACILGGRCDFRAGDYVLHIPAGHFVIVPPGVPYPDGSRGHTEEQGSCDILWLTLWSDVFRCWICHTISGEHSGAERAESCFIQEPQALSYFRAISEEAAAGEEGYQQVCHGLMAALWTVLARRIGQGHYFQSAGYPIEESSPPIQAESPIEIAQHYIRSHLSEHLTIADVAQRVYLSRAQFARRFHEETGQTFTTFITECRLREAQRLLIETEWPISTVSELTGVTSTHLRELFVRHTGVSPRNFRREQRAVVR